MSSDSARPSHPTCRVISGPQFYQGKQGPQYAAGVSAESVGATGIWLGLITVPPGGRTKAHLHENHETAIYVLSGHAEMWYGDGLSDYVTADPGDFVYIPAGCSHVAGNRSTTEPLVGIASRTDPNEQESVVLQPELDSVPPPIQR